MPDKYEDYRITPEGFAPSKNEVITYTPDSKYIDGSLAHALVPIDTLWCMYFPEIAPWIHYPPEDVVKLVESFKNVGGAVTINVPIDYTGKIPQESIDKLLTVKKAIRK